jgi:hypothetical protein
MNEDQKSELLLKCVTWLGRADGFRAEAKRAKNRRKHARLAVTATTLQWAALDLTAAIQSLEEDSESGE